MHWLHLLYEGYTMQSTLLNDIQPKHIVEFVQAKYAYYIT